MSSRNILPIFTLQSKICLLSHKDNTNVLCFIDRWISKKYILMIWCCLSDIYIVFVYIFFTYLAKMSFWDFLNWLIWFFFMELVIYFLINSMKVFFITSFINRTCHTKIFISFSVWLQISKCFMKQFIQSSWIWNVPTIIHWFQISSWKTKKNSSTCFSIINKFLNIVIHMKVILFHTIIILIATLYWSWPRYIICLNT